MQRHANWTQIRNLGFTPPRHSGQRLPAPPTQVAWGKIAVAYLPLVAAFPIAAPETAGGNLGLPRSRAWRAESRGGLVRLPPVRNPLGLAFLCQGLVCTHRYRPSEFQMPHKELRGTRMSSGLHWLYLLLAMRNKPRLSDLCASPHALHLRRPPTALPSFPSMNRLLLPGPIIKGGAGGGELRSPLLPG